MKHFVGCSSQGYLYESRSGEMELHPEYVGQVIDTTDVVGTQEYAVGAIVAPWCVCNEAKRQQKWICCTHRICAAKNAAKRKKTAAAHCAKNAKGSTGRSSGGRAVNAATAAAVACRNAADAASCAAQTDQDLSQQQQGYPPPGYPPPGYPPPGYPPPGYPPPAPDYAPQGYPPPGYPPPEYYAPQEGYAADEDGGYEDGGYEDGGYEDDGQYAAGAAPSGLGSTIGGIAGGALGMFAGSPEIGAPLGAALGGAIQGGVCQASQGHGGGVQGHASIGQGQGQKPSSDSEKVYFANGKKIALAGTWAPDNLFDPSPSPDASRQAIIELIVAANDELRKLMPGNVWGGHRQSHPQTAAAGFFDLPRYASIAEGWTEDQLSYAADWVADKVSGPVPEERSFVMGSSDDSKSYGPYTQNTVNGLLSALPNAGMSVSGNNPYTIDTHSHGVTLQARWDGSHVNVSITGKNFYVSKGQVWGKLDALMPASDA